MRRRGTSRGNRSSGREGREGRSGGAVDPIAVMAPWRQRSATARAAAAFSAGSAVARIPTVASVRVRQAGIADAIASDNLVLIEQRVGQDLGLKLFDAPFRGFQSGGFGDMKQCVALVDHRQVGNPDYDSRLARRYR